MGTSTQKLIVLKELAGNQPPHLDPVQQFFAPHIDAITHFWVSLWILVLIIVTLKVVRAYWKRYRHGE